VWVLNVEAPAALICQTHCGCGSRLFLVPSHLFSALQVAEWLAAVLLDRNHFCDSSLFLAHLPALTAETSIFLIFHHFFPNWGVSMLAFLLRITYLSMLMIEVGLALCPLKTSF